MHSHVSGPGWSHRQGTFRLFINSRNPAACSAKCIAGYVDETAEVLASSVSGLRDAPAGMDEGDFVIVDGNLIPTDRIAAAEPAPRTSTGSTA